MPWWFARSLRVLVAATVVSAAAAAETLFTGQRVLLKPADLNEIDEVGRRLLYLPAPPYSIATYVQADQADRLLAKVVPKAALSFGRQYFVYEERNATLLQVRGFCPGLIELYRNDPWWLDSPVDLMHTGSCTFRADIDLVTDRILQFEWGVPDPDVGE
jgi:hypothetical protein